MSDVRELSCMEVWGGNEPAHTSFHKAGLNIWLYSRPYDAGHGGGDTYYLSSCASGRITRLLLADIAGHGESASGSSLALRDLMRKHINQIRPKQLFARINHEFTTRRQDRRFATALLLSYFLPRKSLTLCVAGHPLPLLSRAGSERWQQILLPTEQMSDLPLGVVQDSGYQELEFRFGQDDALFCFTDGLSELQDERGQQLGAEGIRECLETHAGNHESAWNKLLERVQAAEQDGRIQDDISMLMIQGNGRPIQWKDNLLAPWRLINSPRTES